MHSNTVTLTFCVENRQRGGQEKPRHFYLQDKMQVQNAIAVGRYVPGGSSGGGLLCIT